MDRLKRYIAFVNGAAPYLPKKQVRNACISIAVMIALGDFAAPFAGFELNRADQIIILLLDALIFFTYLPIFSLLPSVLCILSLFILPISLQSFSRLCVAFAGFNCYLYTRTMYRAFKICENSGNTDIQNFTDTLIDAGYLDKEVGFMAKCKCPHCGGIGQYISRAGYSRSILQRLLAPRAAWTAYCPQCQSVAAMKGSDIKKLALDSGQYAVYKRVEPSNGWLAAFGAFACAFISAAALLAVITMSNLVVYSVDVKSSKLGLGKQFVGENLTMIDCFTTNVRDDWSGDLKDADGILALHMIAYLENENGMYFIPVNIESDDDVFMPCLEYISGNTSGPLFSNIHGYIGIVPGEVIELFTDMAKMYEDDYPGIIIADNEIIYWDNEAAPRYDKTELQVIEILVVAAGLASLLFFALDKYVNSETYSEAVQNRYSMRTHG